MPTIEILESGQVVRSIIADAAFAEEHYPGAWRIVPEPAPAPPAPPMSCRKRQGELALLQVGRLDAVDAAMAAIADPISRRRAQIEYGADVWERSNPFLQSMWAQLGGTPDELDELFVLAVTL